MGTNIICYFKYDSESVLLFWYYLTTILQE